MFFKHFPDGSRKKALGRLDSTTRRMLWRPGEARALQVTAKVGKAS